MHLGSEWFDRAKTAFDKGINSLHDYGIALIARQRDQYYGNNLHKIPAFHPKYVMNPFLYQYDLTMHIWINYYGILKREIELRKRLHISHPSDGHGDKAYQLESTNELYGITRTDFLFAAAQMRWPTTIDANGAHRGMFIRDPWSEMRVDAASDEFIKYIISFGGGGQGKTHVSLAILLMMFDYYMFTLKGARCMISTVNESKLKSVGWAVVTNLNASTEPGISLTAGQAKSSGDYTLLRPNKDKGGVFKGILVAQTMDDQKVIDKLTGTHGHPFVGYILDEMQSTQDAPIVASSNFTMHCKDFRIFGAGNYGKNSDTLAVNIKPDQGWDKVDEKTGRWKSTMQHGQKAIVLHFNNNLSPGMDEEGNKKFPHLPSRANLEKQYPMPSLRVMTNLGYRRFWVGFRVSEADDESVLSEALVKENLANLPLELSRLTHTFFSFDSAQGEIDRNLQGIFREGICVHTGNRVFGIDTIYSLPKSTESLKYYRESSAKLYENAQKHNIMSGHAVLDWTGKPAHAEMLQEKNFYVKKITYNQAVPDGIRRDPRTGMRDPQIHLNIQPDFKQDIPVDQVCAHHICENAISLGAWALRQYVLAGRVRGITAAMIPEGSKATLEDELYSRKFEKVSNSKYGERFRICSKEKFKAEYGFSTDVLDIWMQAAWYMLVYRNLPLTPAGNDAILLQEEKTYVKDEVAHSSLWDDDLIYQ